jgi:hypothetical protein
MEAMEPIQVAFMFMDIGFRQGMYLKRTFATLPLTRRGVRMELTWTIRHQGIHLKEISLSVQ